MFEVSEQQFLLDIFTRYSQDKKVLFVEVSLINNVVFNNYRLSNHVKEFRCLFISCIGGVHPLRENFYMITFVNSGKLCCEYYFNDFESKVIL